MSSLLILNTRDTDGDSFTLARQVAGDWELIHQWMEYHEPDAVDYTSNRIKYTPGSTGLETHHDLPDQTTLDGSALATDLSAALGADATVTGNDKHINILCDNGTDLSINWTDSRAAVLFTNAYGTDTIAAGNDKDYYFRDRSSIRHYNLTIDQAQGKVVTSNGSSPTLLISAYDDIVTGQTMQIVGTVEALDFSVREYGALVDLNPEDIPEIHMVFKKSIS